MSKWNAFKLRMSLLKIWFFKNLVVFIELLLLISVVLILTGQISPDTPILGVIFGDLSIAINEIINQRYSDDIVVNLITIIVSLLVTVGTLSTNLKHIALSDIKNPELKKMLIRAGLYFNKDGKLVKKVEVATKIDIDGDNKIGDVEVTDIPKEGLVPGLKRSVEELGTILSIKIESETQVEEIKEQSDLKDTEMAVNEILPAAVVSAKEVAAEQVAAAVPEMEEARKNIFAKAFSAAKDWISAGASTIKNKIVSSSKWVWDKILAASKAVAGVFKKVFTKKEKPAKVKREKKIEKNEKVAIPLVQPIIEDQPLTPVQVQPQPKAQPQVVHQKPAAVDPIEALRRKYGN